MNLPWCVIGNFHPTSCVSFIPQPQVLNVHYQEYLYPTQRVAEGIMFLTCLSVSQSVSPSVLFFLVSATPLKLLDRIL